MVFCGDGPLCCCNWCCCLKWDCWVKRPSILAILYGLIGKFEGDYEPEEDPSQIWNEENVDVDRRGTKGDWRKGKNVNQQIAAIVNNNQLAYRMLDCMANPLVWLAGMLPGISCMMYGYAEHKMGMNNMFMATMKSIACFPFFGPMWMSYPTRTVIREAQEVSGTPASDFMAFALCWMFQPFQLFMNAYYTPSEWIPAEFSCESLDLQECHDVETEKTHLD